MYSNNTDKSEFEKMLYRRNSRLIQYMERIFDGFDVRLHGDPNKPSVIINDELFPAFYVHNFDLHFCDNRENGSVMYTVKMNKEIDFDEAEVAQWLRTAHHQLCYKIKLTSAEALYISGYNSFDKSDPDAILYPVFARYKNKCYPNLKYAEHVFDRYKNEYPLEIVREYGEAAEYTGQKEEAFLD